MPNAGAWMSACYSGGVSEQIAKGRTDEASIEVAADPGEVYAAFADRDALVRWLPPGTMAGRILDYDFREGGRYRIALTHGEDSPGNVGKTSERTDVSSGRFVELVPRQRIVQSVEFESTDSAFAGEMMLTWSFAPTATGTRVTITAENVPQGISRADHAAGLRSSLENLAKFLGC
jgi:uncharacterized protein YndB with AHSA1/START domain